MRDVISPGAPGVPLLLVPAFPAAGRVTIGGVHLLERDGERVPLDRTEYATDAHLSLRRRAPGAAGRTIARAASWPRLTRSRSRSHRYVQPPVRRRWRRVSGRRRRAAVPRSWCRMPRPIADLEVIASGLRLAEADTKVIARCAPAFAAIVTGTAATGLVAPPRRGPRRAGAVRLVRARDHRAAGRARPGAAGRDDVRRRRARSPARRPTARSSGTPSPRGELIDAHGLAVVATPRDRDAGLVDAASQQRIATELARVPRLRRPGCRDREGRHHVGRHSPRRAGARSARVVGPVVTGVVALAARGRPRLPRRTGQRRRAGTAGRARRSAAPRRRRLTCGSRSPSCWPAADRSAVGAFTCYDLEVAAAVLQSAGARGQGVILLIGGRSFTEPHGRLLLAALRRRRRRVGDAGLRAARPLRRPRGDRGRARAGRRCRDGRRLGAGPTTRTSRSFAAPRSSRPAAVPEWSASWAASRATRTWPRPSPPAR